MLTFKRIDCWIQGLTILAGIILCLSGGEILSGSFMAGYCIVGGWQIVSFIVHLFYKAPYSIYARKVYGYSLLFLILAFVVGWGSNDFIIGILVGLLILSPLMAIFYFIISIRETNQLTTKANSTKDESPAESSATL